MRWREKSRGRLRAGVAAATLSVLLILGSAVAAAPAASDFPVSGPPAVGSDLDPAVAFGATSGEYLVVWTAYRDYWTNGMDIYGRRVAASGARLGSDFLISSSPYGDEQPAVVWNSKANEYLVVWVNSDSGLRGRRLSASGQLLGAEIAIDGPDPYGVTQPALAYNRTANQFLVVWTDTRNSSSRGIDLYGRRVAASGKMLGAEMRVSGAKAIADEYYPAVAWNSQVNQYLVVWDDGRRYLASPGSGDDIYGRGISAAGKPLGPDFRINRKAGSVSNFGQPALAYSPAADQFLVAWQDGRSYSTRQDDIYARLVSGSGAAQGDDVRVVGAKAVRTTWNPEVAWDPLAGRYLVVWEDWRSQASRGADIYGRYLSVAGAPLNSEFRISGAGALADDQDPALARGAAGGAYLVVWKDARNYDDGTSEYDIYGRRLAG